jgi:SH3 domain protein
MHRFFTTPVISSRTLAAILFSFTAVLISTAANAAPTAYITESISVSMRENPSKDSAGVGAPMFSGAAVTILETRNDIGYSLVKTETDQRGWLPSQYLTDKPIAKSELDLAQKELQKLSEAFANSQKELETLKSLNTDEGKVAMLDDNQRLSFELEELKKISANAMRLDQDNKALLQTNSMLKNDIDILQTDYQRLKDSTKNDAFMNGAYAVIIGIIATLLIARLWPRKRSEWN